MYAIGICCGRWTAGNNGLQKLHNKTIEGQNRELSTMIKVNDYVVIVQNLPQSVCEMNNGRFMKWLETNTIRIVKGV